MEVMGNYELGVNYRNPYRFLVNKEERPTEKITSYTFSTRDKRNFPLPITVIDTPGFQRRKPEEDNTLREDILNFIRSSHKLNIHAVVYVVPGSQVTYSILHPARQITFFSICKCAGMNVRKIFSG